MTELRLLDRFQTTTKLFEKAGIKRILKRPNLITFNRIAVTFCVFVLLTYPLIYIGNYAGDSQVHLIYGENAAYGNFFEFNPGDASPGVTSPGFMILIAAFFKVAPDLWVPALVKITNLLFWYGLVLLIFLSGRLVLGSSFWGLIAALTGGLLPGSAYNSTNGMENGLFGFVILLWIYISFRLSWFSNGINRSHVLRDELLLGTIIGFGCWLRPEGFVVAALALGYRGFLAYPNKKAVVIVLKRSLVFLFPFLVITSTLTIFHQIHTGFWIPTSGVSRIIMSNMSSETTQLGSLFISPKFAIRLVQYFPITALGLVGIWCLVRQQNAFDYKRADIGFLAVVFVSFFFLYSTILGSVHLSRYAIFIMPLLILLSSFAAKILWEARVPFVRYGETLKCLTAAGLALTLISVFSVETNIRLGLDNQSSLWKSMKAPSERQALSDTLYDQLGRPQKLPVVIALQEVQVRYWLDDRFIVQSLDGRVDPRLLDFSDATGIDHIGYLDDREVEFILDTPSYNRDDTRWSLKRLADLAINESISMSGLRFTKLGQKDNTEQSDNGNIFFTGSDGPAALRFFVRTLIKVEREGDLKIQ